jgi:alpha-mannosidase
MAGAAAMPLWANSNRRLADPIVETHNKTEGGTRVLHIIAHSHIDAAWLWPWRDGENEVHNTFRSALNRMQETADFRFSHSSAVHYRWVERADPALLTEVRSRIQEGRWEVVGGWPVEPDCNIPATESLIRHCLYGKAFVQRAFGVNVEIGFNPDSFGHAAGLPTILRHTGYRYYAFCRPQDQENMLPHLFWWEGPDGSRVLTLRMWPGYDADAEGIVEIANRAFAPGFSHAAVFIGVGDHGGAVTKAQIKRLLELSGDPALPHLRWSTLREFFAAVETSPSMVNLPVVRGELQHHARGSYSAYGEGKYQNRRAERALVQAETVSLVAAVALNHEYPSGVYAEAWWKVLFCQFHDLLAGTAQYSDYQDVRDSVGYACEVAQTNKVEALETLARRVDTASVKEGAVFLFNSLPWPRRALVEFVADDNPSKNAPITHLKPVTGRPIALQWRPADNLTKYLQRASAWVDLPACGYQVFELAHGAPPETEPFREFVSISDVGFGIKSLSAADGTQLLSAPLGLVVISDTSDTWAHGIVQFRQEMGRPQFVSSTVIENGPVTRVTRQRARWQNSEIILDIAQFSGLEFVELRFVIDWREHEQILKLEIPTALRSPQIHAKVPGAAIERSVNGDEEPYQDWVAVTGQSGRGDYTLALVNNSTYSYDCLAGLLRTVLIRAVPFARHNPTQVPHDDINAWQDQGRQERRFWLLARQGRPAALDLDRLAEELQSPAEYIMDSAHAGSESWQRSFLEIEPRSVVVLALKYAEEDGNRIVIRMQERAGQATEARVISELLEIRHAVKLKPWEIKTLLVTPNQGTLTQVAEVSGLER